MLFSTPSRHPETTLPLRNDWDKWDNWDTPVKPPWLSHLTVKHMRLSLGHRWDNWDTSESGRFRTAQHSKLALLFRPRMPSRQRRLFDRKTPP
jgi:hypothetical protein